LEKLAARQEKILRPGRMLRDEFAVGVHVVTMIASTTFSARERFHPFES
jgi:hypothetical protein